MTRFYGRVEKVSLKKLRRKKFDDWAAQVGPDHNGNEYFGTARAYIQDGIVFSKLDHDFFWMNPDADIIPCEAEEIRPKKIIWRRILPRGIREPKVLMWLADNSIKDI